MSQRTIRKLSIGASPKSEDAWHYTVSGAAGKGTIHSIKFREDLFYTKGVVWYEIWVLVPNEANPQMGDIDIWKTLKFGSKDSIAEEYELNF